MRPSTKSSFASNRAEMLRRRTAVAVLATMISVPALVLSPAKAASLTWDPDTVTSGANGGAGTWDSNTTANWWNGAADVVWPNTGTNNDAVFDTLAGTVTIGAGGVTANDLSFNIGGYTLSGATLTLNGTTPTITTTTGTTTISSVVAGTAGLTKAGAGTLTLTGLNTYSGNTTINAGNLTFSAGNEGLTGGMVLNGGTLSHTGAGFLTVGGALNVAVNSIVNVTNSGASNQLFFDAGVTGSGNLTINNTGTATTGVSFRNSAGSYSGTLLVNGGQIGISSGAGLVFANSDVTLNGASMSLAAVFATSATNASVKSLAGNATSTVLLGAQTLTLGSNNGTGSNFAGVISGTGGIGKVGAGTLALSGANTYSGSTTVAGGTLQLDFATGGTSNIISASSALVLGGGTLEVKGGSGEANTQTFNGVSGVGGTLNLTQNSATSINATLGAITANSVNFVGADSTVAALGSFNFQTTTTTTGNDGTTRLGSSLWNGTDWASTSSQNGANRVVQWQGSYDTLGTNDAATNTNTTGNLKISGGTGAGTATTYNTNTTINSLLMVESANSSTVDLTPGTKLTIGSGASPTNAAVAIGGNANSLTIGSTVGQGTLTAGTSGATTLVLANHNTASTLTINSVVSDNTLATGLVSLSTVGNVVLNAANTYSGGTTLGGVLQIGGVGTLGNGTYAGAISNNGTLRYSSSTDQVLSGVISSFGGLTKDTANSILTLTGANTYTGATIINAGTLQLSYVGNVNPTANSSSYTIASGTTLKLNNTSTTTNTAAPSWSKFTGPGTLVVATAKTFDSGWGTPTLGSGFTGTLQVEGGRVIIGTPADLGGTTSLVVKTGGQLGMWQGGTYSQNFTIAGVGYGEGSGYNGALRLGNTGITTIINGNVTLAGNTTLVAQAGGFGVFNGNFGESTASNLTIGDTSAQTGTMVLNGVASYTGLSTAAFGTLQFGKQVAFYNNNQASWTKLVVNSGATAAFNVGGTGEFTSSDIDTIQGLTNIATGTPATAGFKNGSIIGLDTTNASGGNFTYGTVIADHVASPTTDTLGLTKLGTGTLTLTGANTYTGVTRIGAGTLSVGTLADGGLSSNIGASANVAANLVFAGGTLQYTGATASTDRSFTVSAASNIEVTNPATTLTIANSVATAGNSLILTKTGTGTLSLAGTADNSSLFVAVSTGELDLAKSANSPTRAAAGIASVASGATVKLTGIGNDQIYGGNAGVNYGVNGLAGTLDLNGHSESTSNFNGTATGLVTNSNAAGVVWTVGETNATSTFAGAIQNGTGTVALTKIGTGVQTLSGTNTYTGATNINAGTLQFAKKLSFYNNTPASWTPANLIVASGGTAAFNVGGANEFTASDIDIIKGLTNVANGVTATQGFRNGSILGLDTTNASGGVFAYGGVIANHVAGATTDTLGLIKLGPGTLTLSGVNTYSGTTTVNAGVLRAGSSSAFGVNSAVTLANTAGVTLDLNGQSVAIGSIAGGGTTGGNVTLGSGILTVGGNNTSTSYAGVISGTGGLIKTGNGTLTLTAISTPSGGSTVNGGTLKLDLSPATGTLGSGIGSITVAAAGTLELSNTNTTLDNVLLQNTTLRGAGIINKTGAGYLDIQTGSSIANFTGTFNVVAGTMAINNIGAGATAPLMNLNIASGASFDDRYNSTLAINQLTGAGTLTHSFTDALTVSVGNNNGTSTFSGVIANGGSGSLGIAKNGTGTLTLSGANTYNGTTAVNGGTLALDYTTQNNNKVAAGAALTLAGGNLAITGNGAAATTQTVLSTSLNAGFSNVGVTTGNNQNATLNLNAITRTVGGAMNVAYTGTGTGVASVTTDSLNSSGILGGWATIGGTDWAINSTNAVDGKITAYTGYTPDAWAAGNNTDVTVTGPASGLTTNSLRFNTAGATTLSLASGASVITSGGILVTSGVGANDTLINGGTTLAGSNTGDLIVHQNNTGGKLTIATAIANNTGATALTKTGAGLLALTGTNTYTGATFVDAGTLQAGSASAFGSNSAVTMATAVGTTLDLNNLDISIGSLAGGGANGGNVTLGSGTLTAGGNNTSTAFAGAISGTGGLIKAGSGTLTLSGANNYTGNTTITGGTLSITGTGSLAGGTYGGNIANSGTFIWNSTTAQAFNGSLGGTGTYRFTAGTSSLSGSTGTSNFQIEPTVAGTTVGIAGGTYAFSNFNLLQDSINNSTATYNQSGGTVNVTGTFQLGASNAGGSSNDINTANITGGTLTTGTLRFYKWANSTLNIQSGASVTAATLDLGWVDSAPTGTLNVGNNSTAGTLAWGDLTVRSNRFYTLNLDNGTIKATKTNAAWIPATEFTTMSVKDAGGTIDNGGFNVTIGQVISHGGVAATDGGLIFAGAGITTLGGSNTYTGATSVNAGTLLVNGSITGSVAVNNGGTLGGSGGTVGATTVNTGGTLSPGSSIGTLNVAGLTFNGGGAFKLEINSTALTTDLLNTTGTISLGTGLVALNAFDLGSGSLTNGAFTFMHADGGITGTFAGLTEGSLLSLGSNQFAISYAANGGRDVVLTAVPEPGALAALLGGTGMLLGLRRRRRA